MSRQERAAAATQNLLKVDAARVRKAAATQSRKDAAAPMRKQRTSGVAAHVPEQRTLGGAVLVGAYGSGSFFNGGANGFFGSGGQSPIQPWMYQSSDPSTW